MNEDAEVRHRTVLDSDIQQAGDVYAKALLGAVDRTGGVDETNDELREIVDEVFARNPKFAAFLESPRIDAADKRRAVEEVFGGRVRQQTLNLLRILADNGRFDSLGAIHGSFRKLVQERRNEVDVAVLTAEPLTDDLREQVRAKLSATLGKQIHLVEQVKPDLIGGLVVRVGDTVYDGSLSGQFDRLRDSVLEATRAQMRDSFDRFSVPDSPAS